MMLRFSRSLPGITLAAALAVLSATTAAQAQVLITQIYTTGGKTGATYNRDFVELVNNGTSSINLKNYTLSNTNNTGNTFNLTLSTTDFTLNAGQFFLVGLGSDNMTVGGALPTVDFSNTAGNLNTAAYALFVKDATGTTTDLVGMGTGNSSEGSLITAVVPNNASAYFRLSGSPYFQDTNNNISDFAIRSFAGTFGNTGYVGPRNSTISLATAAPEASPLALSLLGIPLLTGVQTLRLRRRVRKSADA